MRGGAMRSGLTTDEITKSLAYMLPYFSIGVAVSRSITLGASAYFGFAVLAASITVVGGLHLAPLLGGQPPDWDPRGFFATPLDSVFAASIVLIAGLSAATACGTIHRSSVRTTKGNGRPNDWTPTENTHIGETSES